MQVVKGPNSVPDESERISMGSYRAHLQGNLTSILLKSLIVSNFFSSSAIREKILITWREY